MRRELIEKIAVTFELCGGVELSEGAKMAIVADLERYTGQQVSHALDRCRREVKRLTLPEIIERIDDGRPGPQEAWAMIPSSESASVVWTDEISDAYGVSSAMVDKVGARMSFIEAYNLSVQKARSEGRPVNWWLSPGSDRNDRDRALVEAVTKGRMTSQRALGLLSFPEQYEGRLLEASCETKALPISKPESKNDGPEKISDLLKPFFENQNER